MLARAQAPNVVAVHDQQRAGKCGTSMYSGWLTQPAYSLMVVAGLSQSTECVRTRVLAGHRRYVMMKACPEGQG
jgi:hypothetical protein